MQVCGECVRFNPKEKICNFLKRRCQTLRFGDCKRCNPIDRICEVLASTEACHQFEEKNFANIMGDAVEVEEGTKWWKEDE
jgi:hypothetical protein